MSNSGPSYRLQERLRDPPVEPKELVVSERCPAVEQAGVAQLPSDQRVLPVVVSKHISIAGHAAAYLLPLPRVHDLADGVAVAFIAEAPGAPCDLAAKRSAALRSPDTP